jgi:Uma2 family endonuclease
MSTARRIRPITVEEHLEGEMVGDIRHEFVGGQVFSMVGASQAHNLIAMNIATALHNHLRGTGCRVFGGTMKLRIGDDFYYPDVLVACDRTDAEPYFVTRPSLIVEVLSPGTAVRDTEDKLLAYRSIETLREYVIAEQDRREVRIHRRAGGAWDTSSPSGSQRVRFDSVDLTPSLDEICRDVLPDSPLSR